MAIGQRARFQGGSGSRYVLSYVAIHTLYVRCAHVSVGRRLFEEKEKEKKKKKKKKKKKRLG